MRLILPVWLNILQIHPQLAQCTVFITEVSIISNVVFRGEKQKKPLTEEWRKFLVEVRKRKKRGFSMFIETA